MAALVQNMRLFIAIEIPDEIKESLIEAQRSLKGSGVEASWPRPEGIHLTLKFLGEVAEPRIPEMMKSLQQAATGTGPVRLELSGAGTFPNPKNARVAWVGLNGDIEKLSRLQATVEEAMIGMGFKREERAFTPHLTLGRIKYIRSRESWLAALDGIKGIKSRTFEAASISLMKSELKPSGAVYAEMGRIELK
jgi:2'-5' RNA ligase